MVELYTPCFKLEVAAADKTEEIWRYLDNLQYSDLEEGESDTLSFTVANYPSFSIPERGAAVRLWLGWKEGGMKYFGSFNVDEISGNFSPATMTITAKSAYLCADSTLKQKADRQWEKISLADLTAKIAAKHGCKARVSINTYYTYQAQTNESDMAFLKRLAQEAGGSLTIKDKTFVIAPSGTPTRSKTSIQFTAMCSGSFSVQDREKYGSVKAVWWDKENAKEVAIVEGKGQPTHRIRKRFASAAEAKSAISGYLAKLNKSQVSLDITIPGDPTLVSGAEVTCSGFSPKEVNGKYLAKSVTHNISKTGGWTTDITLDKIS